MQVCLGAVAEQAVHGLLKRHVTMLEKLAPLQLPLHLLLQTRPCHGGCLEQVPGAQEGLSRQFEVAPSGAPTLHTVLQQREASLNQQRLSCVELHVKALLAETCGH